MGCFLKQLKYYQIMASIEKRCSNEFHFFNNANIHLLSKNAGYWPRKTYLEMLIYILQSIYGYNITPLRYNVKTHVTSGPSSQNGVEFQINV